MSIASILDQRDSDIKNKQSSYADFIGNLSPQQKKILGFYYDYRSYKKQK